MLPESPHALSVAELLRQLRVSSVEGLSVTEVDARRKRYGPNTITFRRATSAMRLLLHQFESSVVYLLSCAAGLAFYFGELEEGSAIIAVLAINALIGFMTELKAARSIEALRALGARTVRVRREGRVRVVPAEELVPGDVVVLDAGDAVSADLRLIETSRLSADESTLTGESVTVDKQTRPVSADSRLGDRASMAFKGTAVTRGTGVGVVVATGLGTELGRVTQLVLEADPGSSPLERKLGRLSAQLVWATVAVAAVIGAVGLMGGKDPLLMVEAAIALAVAAIPEGLPIVATLALARGMWRMARQNALIERLSAVETLGATTVILTDKTGTLTQNRMTVRRLCVASGEIELETEAPKNGEYSQLAGDRRAVGLLRIAVLCNDANLDRADESGSGDPMEVALLRAGLHAGLRRSALLHSYRIIRKHAFDPSTKMMATVHEHRDGMLVAVKGAPEAVLAAANRVIVEHDEVALDDAMRAEWLSRADQFGHHGLRVIACAMKMDGLADVAPYEGLVLVGLIGLEDPARADVPQAIRDCRQAGIRVVMVTGDHSVTARSIGRAVGLEENIANVVEGKNIAQVIESGPPALREVGIFARVNPDEKLALVRAYQAAGEIVAMTGDGVNDAPALRQADIGVAMGLRGTDVAREAAAMILLDDAFPTILGAIREGRIIFANIRRFVAYLLSCNLSEVMVVGLAVLLALPLPLLPLQILYLNLVTDVFPAFALAMGDGEAGVLRHPPRDPREPILGRWQWITIILHGGALTAGTFGALAGSSRLGLDAQATVTVTFLTLAFAQLWHTFNMRDPQSPLIVNGITQNGWLWSALLLCATLLAVPPYLPQAAHLLHLVPPTADMWSVVLLFSLAPMIVTQAISAVVRAWME
ncbi:cation-transporting P-type ATPase [Bradyrhizobium elkanii]|uniref:Cation-transporting P-type ATPase n=2 Tax=Nitrobacteraceae TaxID=41294 RepID=A0A4U6S9E9_BRAEL|nr:MULTISPECIES: cation-transporting P-type ATPase [Bradyrhizobium]MTV15480.1 cation-transporting P-type ATPase [Bradyrhizobium sp. BR2003]TKV81336.1 cation-transporting P-type ATPase [Bradyrhizobium elkanii]